MNLRILDLTAGNRGIWIDKEHRDAVFIDIRPNVRADIVADACSLPPEVGDGFDLIVFDPPHVNFGANSNMSRDYGHHTTTEIREFIRGASKEAHRVSVEDALVVFKWNDHDQKLGPILALMSDWWEPLFGHQVGVKTKHYATMQWVMLRRRPPSAPVLEGRGK